MRLHGRAAIVTGSSQNIGKEIALLFAREGASVALVGRDAAKGEAVARQIGGEGGQAIFVRCDVTDPEQVARLVSTTAEQFGKLDILVNNVGNGWYKRITEQSLEEWRVGIDITLNSAYYCTKYALQQMLRQGHGGVIVSISSIDGLLGEYGFPAYNAGKAGMINLMRSVALDYATHGIRANSVCPGQVEETVGQSTQRNELVRDLDQYNARCIEPVPMKRRCHPLEVAHAALFLASEESSYITGTTLVVDGGLLARTGLPDFSELLRKPEGPAS